MKIQVNIKKCGGCGEVKHRTEFSKNKRMKDGLQTQCKACNKKKNKKFREKNPEYMKEWTNKNPNYKTSWTKDTEESIVYVLKNVVSGEIYYGSSKNNRSYRRSYHFSLLRRNKHCNEQIQQSYNLFGEEAFDFQVIHQCENPETARRIESWYIQKNINKNWCLNQRISNIPPLNPTNTQESV